jgi:hypothetical protein
MRAHWVYKSNSIAFLGRTCPTHGGTRTEAINREANRFDHVRKLEDTSHLSSGAPNNDSRACAYEKDEPIILTVPGIRDR